MERSVSGHLKGSLRHRLPCPLENCLLVYGPQVFFPSGQRGTRDAAPQFAEDLLTASRVAAQRGDSRPAQFGLLHSRAVAPVDTREGPGGGFVVNIGMAVGNIPATPALGVVVSEPDTALPTDRSGPE